MKILIIDDDLGLRDSLSLILQEGGHEAVAEGKPRNGLERALADTFDIVLCDVRMPDMNGLEFLREHKRRRGSALVIMMSAYGGEDAALAAMQEGAYDYLPKPFRRDEVLLTLRKAEEREQLKGRVASLEAELARRRDLDIVADSPAMRQVMELATLVAPHDTTLLITGESGTGKEVIARAIHRMSPRRAAPFVAVNCGAIPENLLESELFGHTRSAFTGATRNKIGLIEEANGGTLLLDEIGDLPLPLQVKLLRVLQESEVRRVGDSQVRKINVRFMSATVRDLEAAIVSGDFREDLFYRLNVVRIHIAPLRERPEDLDGLVARLLERESTRAGRKLTLAPGAFEAIKESTWPGNVRELENALERVAVLSTDGVIRPEGFGSERRSLELDDRRSTIGGERPTTLKAALDEAERRAVEIALDSTGGSRVEAARILGVSLRTLYYKLKHLAA